MRRKGTEIREALSEPPFAHPGSASAYSAPTLTVREGDAGCGRDQHLPSSLASWGEPLLAPGTPKKTRGDMCPRWASEPAVLQVPLGPQSPPAIRGAAHTYLQPGFPVAATPSDVPAAFAGRRQPYRSCIASKMPIRCHHPGA